MFSVTTTRILEYLFLTQLDSARRRNQNLRPSLFVTHWTVQTPFHVIDEVRGRAILTVESSGQKLAYYFTFVPDASPLLTQTPSTDTSGKQRPCTSDESALLVRLKEREGNAVGGDCCPVPWTKRILAPSPLLNKIMPQGNHSS
jgi:hypothetical protein